MDEPKFIPDGNIRDINDRVPDDVDRLRPKSRRPFTVDSNSVTLRFLFEPRIPVESLHLVRPENVNSITVTYKKPKKTNEEVQVVEVNVLRYFESYDIVLI